MKILIITNLFPLPWQRNRATFNRQQFARLAHLCQVKVLALIAWPEAIRHRKQMSSSSEQGMAVDYQGYFYTPAIGRIFYPLLMLPALLRRYSALRRDKPDCLLLSWAFPDAVAGTVLAALLRRPAVIKVHGSDINMHCSHRLRAAQVVWAMKRAHRVISVSRDLAEKLIRMGVPEEKIEVIYNGVDRTLFKPLLRSDSRLTLDLPAERKIILYIGNLQTSKGCSDLLDAFSRLAAADSDVDLYYIGPGPLAGTLEEKATELGLADRVFLKGTISHDELPVWINASDVLSLPSHNEGVPNVLLETMACGVPVVATRVGGIPEIVDTQAGILAGLSDISALHAALSEALSRDWDREAIVASVSGFTWENNIDTLYRLLQEARGSEVVFN